MSEATVSETGAVKDLVLGRLTSPGEDGWTRLQAPPSAQGACESTHALHALSGTRAGDSSCCT